MDGGYSSRTPQRGRAEAGRGQNPRREGGENEGGAPRGLRYSCVTHRPKLLTFGEKFSMMYSPAGSGIPVPGTSKNF